MVMPSSMPPVPRLLRGSVVVRRRRCGKPNCRCADGQQLHEAPALSYSDRGRTKIVLLDTACGSPGARSDAVMGGRRRR
jgi:hypothetical protein